MALFNPFPYNSQAFWIWNDWGYYIMGAFALAIVVAFIVAYKRKKGLNRPTTMLSEFDKAGYVNPYIIEDEQEGPAFLVFERQNTDVDIRRIGQPFTFILDDETIERNHLNPRGSHDCVDPAKLFVGYAPTKDEKNVIVNEITQHFRQLRTGGTAFGKLKTHLRMFVLIFILACMVGIGLAAAFHHPANP